MTLLTRRLILRRFTQTDFDDVYQLFNNPKVMQYGLGIKTPEQAEAWLYKQSDVKNEFFVYALECRQKPGFIGYCGLKYFPAIDNQAEIELGYRLFPQFWGQGLATEAALAVKNNCLERRKIPRLISLIDPANTASIRVVEKLGMRFEKAVMLPGYTYPDHLYSVQNNK